ncbi:hypothetical protein ACSBR2_004030 [Camellia fascicularis]
MTTLTTLIMENIGLQDEIPTMLFGLPHLQTVMMENIGLQGEISTMLFGLPHLQTVNNKLNGTLDVGSSFSSQLRLIDLQKNSIDSIAERLGLNFTFELISMQGFIEFKSEIELLSRVHHKNIVSLVGFCFELDEQMLVYEYILNGKLGIKLDWMRRLRIALGSARGLQYLHELANPTIIHRDVKTSNILLDECLNAKVFDFGLSKMKAIGDLEKDHITTQVKGTMGYMDPEYYMTNQLTEKSDVYSFGVVMLELLTGRQPIEKGKYIVREVKQKMDMTKVGYNLHNVLDTAVLGTTLGGLEKFVDLAMRCVEESGGKRPTMG